MNKVWQLQEAKNKFSSLVDKARHDGPQIVTKHGKESVVVLSLEDYQKMNRPKSNLVTFFKNSPLFNSDIDLARDKSTSRDLDL
ncbi:MAG: type II toxin-antitoxin system Phd/YefM family antitoxin [Proteobacteria bacterium]|nr:type II toxin-antitoxin system Phd/YefM family antitoxin [Pseudomonadota bacterium]